MLPTLALNFLNRNFSFNLCCGSSVIFSSFYFFQNRNRRRIFGRRVCNYKLHLKFLKIRYKYNLTFRRRFNLFLKTLLFVYMLQLFPLVLLLNSHKPFVIIYHQLNHIYCQQLNYSYYLLIYIFYLYLQYYLNLL